MFLLNFPSLSFSFLISRSPIAKDPVNKIIRDKKKQNYKVFFLVLTYTRIEDVFVFLDRDTAILRTHTHELKKQNHPFSILFYTTRSKYI